MEVMETSQMEEDRDVQQAVMTMVTDDIVTPEEQLVLGPDLNAWMQEASGIVERFKQRGNVLPLFLHSSSHIGEHDLEHIDASKLDNWKKIVDNKPVCPPEILAFLDSELLHWRDSIHGEQVVVPLTQPQLQQHLQPQPQIHEDRMREAHDIVRRCKQRASGVLPRRSKGLAADSPEAVEEDRDVRKIFEWRHAMEEALSSSGAGSAPSPGDFALDDFLKRELPACWGEGHQAITSASVANTNGLVIMDGHPASNPAMEKARGIYARFLSRGCQMPQQHRLTGGDIEKEQESRDAIKLHEWKQSLLGGGRKSHQNQCPADVCLFLDEYMPLWRDKMEKQLLFNQKAMRFAEGIVERYEARGKVMPVRSKECKADKLRAQEYKDAAKLNDWKQSLRGNKTKTVCCDEVKAYLDEKVGREGGRERWREGETKESALHCAVLYCL
jgi:hypothetical protein